MIANKELHDVYYTKIKYVIAKDNDDENPDIARTKGFTVLFKQFMARALKDTPYKVVVFKGNWKDASGFIHDGEGNFVYVSCGYGFSETGYYDNILIRTAKDIRDFTGGNNHYTTMENFAEDVAALFERGR